jgi:CRP/FNR family transcriptional regulator, cyclic AMP receptor protein
VKATVISEQGKEAVVAVLEEGQFFGEGCLSGQASRIATMTAMTDCRIKLSAARGALWNSVRS